jgi:hypothetical protein
MLSSSFASCGEWTQVRPRLFARQKCASIVAGMPIRRAPPVLVAAVLCAAAPALAQAQAQTAAPPPAERAHVYSQYELETIAEVLAPKDESIDDHPDGKIIEHIEIVPLDVIEPRDPLPQIVNVVHVTSKPWIIRREMLQREGEHYSEVLADETIRNLRRLLQLSLVLVVATRGSAPDRVNVVVITKDVWSLRLNWDVVATPGGIELLAAQPSETNFLGRHQTIGTNFVLEPSAYTLGLQYIVPRIDTSRVALVAYANIMVNRASGSPEGSFGQFIAGQPIYSALTEWAWDASVAWQDFVNRRYTNAQLSAYLDPRSSVATCVPNQNCLPFQFRAREYTTTYELTHSTGWETKHDVTFAAGIDRREYRSSFPGASAQLVADFNQDNVPLSDTRVGPSIQYHTYTKRYVRVIDFDNLALQEDYRLGHDIVMRVYPSFRAIGATRDVLGLYGAAQYSVAVRDGLFRMSVASTTEPGWPRQPTQQDDIADASLVPAAHFVSPTIAGLGRIVFDASLLWRWRNYLNQLTYLGGDDRLRGYPTNFFIGQNVLSYNVELRTRPVEILKCQLAGVGFFDAGDAWNHYYIGHESLGVGIRALFPQLDRLVFRADIGFPIQRPFDPTTGVPIAPYGFVVSFGQAFVTPTVSPAPVLPAGQ